MRATGTRRERGAYFTPDWLAVELAKWAIRAADDTVIDPAAGDGSLVVAAAERLRTFGSLNAGSIEAIELHERTAARLRRRLNGANVGINIQRADFFDTLSRARQRRVVLANPPFVRHHEIPAGLLPKMRAALNGKSHLVGGRASTWAYFLLASTDLLCRGGRLAMVLPTDVLNAEYAQPIVRQLCSQFGSVTLAVIELTAYSGLKTRAVACLADDFGASTPGVNASLARLDPTGLVHVHTPGANDNHGGYASATALGQLATPENARRLLAELSDDSRLIRLGDCARVTIGYVSSASEYFQLSEQERLERRISKANVRRALTSNRTVKGLVFRTADWRSAMDAGVSSWLFAPHAKKSVSVKRYLDHGRYLEVHRSYKASRRSPWWEVPLPSSVADAFLTGLGSRQLIVENRAKVVSSNTLLELRATGEFTAKYLAVASLCSVFQLMAAANSRILSGGLRKLEPSGAKAALVPRLSGLNVAKDLESVDKLVRSSNLKAARERVDSLLLADGLGWPWRRIRELERALEDTNAALRWPRNGQATVPNPRPHASA